MTPLYRGEFGPAQAERLLWRAGFGPRPGEATRLAERGMQDAVRSLTRPGAARLEGPEPHDGKGRSLAPRDAWGHDHLWWLDRMVRSSQPLVERMTLNWHDWFATSNEIGEKGLMLDQNQLFRRHALGSFGRLLTDVTRDPAMLLWLSGSENSRDAPNENYARELMELFAIGAGRGYSERDVREQARALTGFRNDWSEGRGPHRFRYDRFRHDPGVKRIFGKRGRYGWRDAVRLCLTHKRHPSFFVGKLWSYFVPVEPDRETASALERLYVDGGRAVRPVVEAILSHPAFYEGPRMTKPPVVYIAGMLRALGRGVDSERWTWVAETCGQLLFRPPNVSGWNHERWLDTATLRARWVAANEAIGDERALDPERAMPELLEAPDAAVERALDFWGAPSISAETRSGLVRFAQRCESAAGTRDWKRRSYSILRQNALRMLVATSPDFQTC